MKHGREFVSPPAQVFPNVFPNAERCFRRRLLSAEPSKAVRRRGRSRLAVALGLGWVSCLAPSTVQAQLQNTFFVPVTGDHIRSVAIGVNTGNLGSTGAPNPDTVRSVISLSANVDGTVVYYDHWEDGFEADLENPVQTTTEIFNLDAGDFQALESNVFVSPRNPADIRYDGRDRIGSTEQIAVTRAGWRLQEGTLLAGAVEVPATEEWLSSFEFPVGVDIVTNDMFSYAAASVIAGETGAVFNVDVDGDGNTDSTVTLGPGEATLIEDIEVGGTIVSSDPLQVVLLTGDVGSNFASRWFALVPFDAWGSSYYSPVGTAVIGTDTTVLIYNPNDTTITVTEESLLSTSLQFTYDNTTAGTISFAGTPCAAPLVRTFNVTDSFAIQSVELGFNASHNFRSDIEATLISPAGTSVAVIDVGVNDGDNNYDILLTDSSVDPFDDTTADNVAAPFYDRSVGPSNPFSAFVGEASAGTWTLQICDNRNATNGTFNRAQLRLVNQASSTPTSSTFTVAPSAITEFTMPLDSGAHFFTTTNEPFFALATIDFDGISHDWGFSLLPEEGLSSIQLTGWAVGRDPTSGTNPTENGSPLWVTATAATTLYVDWDGDPSTGALVDPEGNRYDEDFSLSELESLKLFDTTDGDQSGARIYTLDGALLAAAWGQDPATASTAAPGIDLGTTVLPLAALKAVKEGVLFDDADGDGAISGGDTITYRIEVINISDAVVTDITLIDFGLDSNVTYTANTTQVDGVAVPDDVAPNTIFPLDETGYFLGSLAIGATILVEFQALVTDPLPAGVTQLGNQVTVSTTSQIETGTTVTPIQNPVLGITKTSDAVGDVVAGQTINYTVTVNNSSAGLANGIRILDALPTGTSYVAESTTATGFTNVFFGTLTSTDTPGGGIAVGPGASCGAPTVRTFTVATSINITDVDVGFNADHTYRGDFSIDVISPAGTRVQILTENGGDGDDNIDVLFDDASADPLDDNTPDNTAAPLYDRTVAPANPLSAFNGEDALGTWELEFCDNFDVDSGTYNSSELRITGSASTATVSTNQAGAASPLQDGDPTNLVLAPDGFGLTPSQSMTVTYSVTVDDPLPANTTAIVNTATVTSLQQLQPLSATVVDPVDAGAALGDRVWIDIDGDGFQDVGEPGLSGVTLSLFDPGGDGMVGGGDDTLIATATTDANGNYLFDRLPAGSYFVDVTGGVPTGLTIGTVTPEPSAVVTLAAEQVRLDADFGYVSAANGVIGDFIWSDADNDGVQDPGEAGIGGVTVELLDASGSVVTTQVTADDGSYLFTGVAAGEYRVRVAASNFNAAAALDGYSVTSGAQSPGSNLSAPVTVTGGDIFTQVDFGYRNAASTYTITDAVWLDIDADTAFDAGEVGIGNVTVNLLDSGGDLVATTRSAADGSFSFSGVAPGTYTLSMTDNAGELIGLGGTTTAGMTRTQSVTVTAADVTGQNFGFNGEATLGDRLWSDADGDGVQDDSEVGLPGVTVELLDRGGSVIATTTTDAFGRYIFEGIAPERYSVRVSSGTLPAGYSQTGDPDVTLDGLGTATLALGDSDLGLDFGYQNASAANLSGNVFSDIDRNGVDAGAGEPGFAGVTVDLLDASGNVIAAATTDANGDYVFEDLPDGDYQVTVTDDAGVLADTQLTSGLDTLAVTLSGTDVGGLDFGYARDSATGSIGDRVWLDADRDGVQDAAEAGLSGVTLRLYDVGPDGAVGGGDDVLLASTVTDADGGYVFADLPPGTYYVDVDTPPAGLSATTGTTDPSAAVLLSEGERLTDVDFGFAGTAGSSALGDRVWSDVDGDGVQDAGEISIGGVDITVVGPSGTFNTTTAADGSWLVTGLAPGDYTVTVDSGSLPSEYGSVPTNGPASREYAVPSGSDVVTADFGFDGTPLGSIGDLIWLDIDGDGTLDAGEPGLGGVTIDLLDSGGDVVATTTTDGDGSYDFVGVPDGNYQVRVSDLARITAGLTQSSGTNPTSTIALAGGQDYNDADFPFAPSVGSGSIGSLVWNDLNGDGDRDAGEPGLGGVTVDLWLDVDGNGVITPGTDNLLRTVTTDANGEYEILGLVPGDYLVTVDDAAGVLTGFAKTTGLANQNDQSQADPYAVTLTSGSPQDYTADFGYQATTPRAISGTVFEDDNSDATLNGSESGVASVPVVLYLDVDLDGEIDPTDPVVAGTVADGSGNYSFTGLADNRSYLVAVDSSGSAVDGFTQTTQTATAGVEPVALAGADVVDRDFGFVDAAAAELNPAVIGDRVWLDGDGDGTQDVGEPGLPNVVVRIYDAGLDGAVGGGDDVLVASTVTGADGSYSFPGLAAGTYYVDVVSGVPTGLSLTGGSDPTAVITVAAGDIYDTADFGYGNTGGTAWIGNFVWSDADNDGGQDAGEPGIGGVTVDLVSAGPDGVFDTGDDVVEATVTTGDDGWYEFTGVASGEYRVDVTDTGNVLTGYTLTSGPQSASDPTAPFTVNAGDVYHDADFGYRDASLHTISDRVWQDIDGDGVQDAGEVGLEGVRVELVGASGDVIAGTFTDGSGDFSFAGVADGSYTLRITDTAAVLRQFVGTTPPATADELAVTVAGADVSAVSFGYNQPGIFGDTVFSDSDGDGVQDGGELGLGGVTVALWQDADGNGIFDNTVDTFVGNQVTAADGSYLFSGLGQGTFFASVDPSQGALTGYTGTTTDQETGAQAPGIEIEGSLANSAAGFLAADFGFQNPSLPEVSGNVFEDLDRDGVDDGAGEPGFTAVAMELRNAAGVVVATTFTDAAGDYSFSDVPAGNYTVAVADDGSVLDGYSLTSGLDALDITVAGVDIGGLDFGYARDSATASIGDRVWLDSDGDGVQDGAETGLGGVTIELYDAGADGVPGGGDDTLVTSTVTQVDGSYIFTGLEAGSYYTQLDTSTLPSGGTGLTLTTANPQSVALSEGEAYVDADFGVGSSPTTGAIGDFVWFDADSDGVQDPGEIGIGGVQIELTGPGCSPCTTTTDADGSYLFTGLAPGTYMVDYVPATLPAIYTASPTNTTGNIDVDNLMGGDLVINADFGFPAAGSVGSIGDRVWLDVDGDGVQDGFEDGLGGVTVALLDSAGTTILATTTTDSDGNYSFTGLAAGSYRVQVTDTAGVLTGLNLTGGANPTAAIVLSAGQAYSDADFGYASSGGTGSIGDLVWHDIDGDGARDAGEPGLPQVTLSLWHDVNDDGVITPGTDDLVRTATTDLNGEYTFNALPADDYLVEVTDLFGVLAGFSLTSGTADTDNQSQSDPYSLDLTAGDNSVVADFGYQAGSNLDISGTVFFDLDADGLENGADFGVDQVFVYLYRDLDGDGELDPGEPRIDSTVAAADGSYLFEDLPAGDYIVTVDAGGSFVDGAAQTTQTLTAAVEPVTLAGVDSIDNDFGFTRSATLALVVDVGLCPSGDGLCWRTAAEAGTAGFQVHVVTGAESTAESTREAGPFVPAPFGAPQGAEYQLRGAVGDLTSGTFKSGTTIVLEELERTGGSRLHGPYRLEPMDSSTAGRYEALAGRAVTASVEGDGYAVRAYGPDADMQRRLAAARVEQTASKRRALTKNGAPADRLRLLVEQDGLHFVSSVDVAAAFDWTEAEVNNALASGSLRLRRDGNDVAYHPATAGSGSGFYFYGQAREDDLFTETEVYRLDVGGGAVMASVPGGSAAATSTFAATGHLEEDLFAATFVARDADLDYWHWRGLIAGHNTLGSTELSLPVDAPRTDQPVRLTVHLRGASSSAVADEHHAVFEINGAPVAETFFDDLLDHTATFEVDGAAWQNAPALLTVRALRDTGAAQSFFYVDSVTVDYRRRSAVAERASGFFGTSTAVEVDGFTAADLLVLDVSDGDVPRILSDAQIVAGTARFGRPAGASSFHVQSLATAIRPTLEAEQVINWLASDLAGAYVVIAPESLMDAARRLADWRGADFGSAQAVPLEAIMDQMAEGRYHPPAIRQFLQAARASWSVPPTHVALLGKGSLDYRDLQGFGGNALPPLMTATPFGLYSSDNAYADLTGDRRPDIALGRIPVLTSAEAHAYIDKLEDYELRGGLVDAAALFVADNDDSGGAFSSEIGRLGALMPPATDLETLYVGRLGGPTVRQRLLDGLERGVGWVDWMGHGGLDRLGDEGLLLNSDVPALSNRDDLPIFALMSCNVSRFELPGFASLAEALLTADGGGIAAIAPSGLALDGNSFEANLLLVQAVFGGDNTPTYLGDAYLQMMRQFVERTRLASDPQVYQLMGDPGLRLQGGLPGAIIFLDGFESGGLEAWNVR